MGTVQAIIYALMSLLGAGGLFAIVQWFRGLGGAKARRDEIKAQKEAVQKVEQARRDALLRLREVQRVAQEQARKQIEADRKEAERLEKEPSSKEIGDLLKRAGVDVEELK